MPRQAGVSVENNFSRGLITEATGLAFPENACTETYDCVFEKTGEVTRRLGIALESGYEVHQIDSIENSAITEFLWKAVALDGEITFLCLQIGRVINFFEIDADGVLSPNLKTFSINLENFKRGGSPAVNDVHVSFAAGNGQLFIVHPYCDPIFVEYDRDDDDITTTAVNIKVRDVYGVPNTPEGSTTPLNIDFRPTSISGNILYNYFNQGWGPFRDFSLSRKTWGAVFLLWVWRKGLSVFPAAAQSNSLVLSALAGAKYPFGRNDWPSEADFPELFKQPIIPLLDADGNVIPPIPPDEAFCLEATDLPYVGNSPAPKGHFLYEAFNIDRWHTLTNQGAYTLAPQYFGANFFGSNLTPVEIESSGYARPSTVAFFAGRVWYAGVDAPKYNTRIYFSQIVEGNQHIGECYQRQDPTATETSVDLLPSDGGIVVIPDVARVIKLIPYGNSLLVFATNGIWRISGSAEGASFTANDYSVSKISAVGSISSLSFVDADGTPMWWNSDGIYSIKQDGLTAPQAVSLTNSTIQAFYDDIPVINRRYVKGIFNKQTKTVQWLFRTEEFDNIQERYQYNRILNLDLNTGSFYPWTISDACTYVAGITVLDGFGVTRTDEIVTDVGVAVTDGGDNVTDEAIALADLESRFKYVVFNECDIIDPGEGDTPATLTYNKNFLGNNDSADLGVNIPHDAPISGIIVGEDGKFYIPTGTDSDLGTGVLQREVLQRFDGVGTVVNYSIVQFTNDMSSAVGITNGGSTFASRSIIAVPFTQYFYMCAYGQSGGNFYLVFGLYKVNSSGNVEFMNAGHAYSVHFSIAFAAGFPSTINYESFTAESPLNRDLLVAFLGSSTNPFIIRIPSVNVFILNTGKIGVYSDIHTGFTTSNFFNLSGDSYNPEGSNSTFILPTAAGAMICRYVDWATAQAHINNNNPSAQSPAIDAFAPSYPTGFVMASPVSGEAWSVINTSFKDVNGNTLIPFSDVLLDRDGTNPGFAAGNYLNDWTSCVHQYDETNNIHYLIWTRRYRNIEANQTSIGTYRKVLIQTWNPTSQIAMAQADATGGPYDTVVDLGGSVTRYGSYPRMVQSFFDTDYNEVYMYSVYDASSSVTNTNLALAKFGDFTPAVIVDVPEGVMSFGEFSNGDFIDWSGITAGFNYNSYFISGYKLRGEAIRKFQSNYWQVYTRNADPSTFDVHSRWDYANSGNTGRWSSVQRVTQNDTNYTYRTKRLKMRGHGKALQFKVSSVDNEPFNIIGWSSYETTNASI